MVSSSRSTPLADVWYFATLVASGLGFWLICRLIAAAILKRSKSASTKGHLIGNESFEMVSCQQFGSCGSSDMREEVKSANSPTEPMEIIPKSPVEGIEEPEERTANGPGSYSPTTLASFAFP
ncbi:hypothetical protein BDM02DRAFT_3193900 [Thelephora ganbajun]|uniref:Uncharacterized protein n=1 Tax=Thelephora ganbajun TaxID=370292 RepID=A0ACB6YY16_THEGA|nr:hypothetical protein BDM02DRAFT_3193900 [Thelephora ganbajun]